MSSVVEDDSVDPLLRAVRAAAAAQFDVLGEIGRAGEGVRVYLAREGVSGNLVVLRLEHEVGDEFALDLSRRLDHTVPAVFRCLQCGQQLSGWMRFCTCCGADLAGAGDTPGDVAQRGRLLAAVREAVAQEYDVLGEMESKDGQGQVLFARELATGNIVALRLQREADGTYSVGLTRALKRFAAEFGVVETSLSRTHDGTVDDVSEVDSSGVAINPSAHGPNSSSTTEAFQGTTPTEVGGFAPEPGRSHRQLLVGVGAVITAAVVSVLRREGHGGRQAAIRSEHRTLCGAACDLHRGNGLRSLSAHHRPKKR
jgi:hypothetical protein